MGNTTPPINYQHLPNPSQGTPLNFFPRPNQSAMGVQGAFPGITPRNPGALQPNPPSQDTINAAILDYLRQQQQQGQSYDNSDAGSYAGAY